MTDSLLINKSLLQANVDALNEGEQLVGLLEAEQYTQGFQPAFESTIGAHFRHVLEHYRCFIKQMPGRVFCYDDRERDQALECDSEYAVNAIHQIVDQLAGISDHAFAQTYTLLDEQSPGPVETKLQRELLFLQSHTVHHYAMIAAMTRAFGNQPEADFGIAIATRSYQNCNESKSDETRFVSNKAEG